MHSSDEMGDDSGRAKGAAGPAAEKEGSKLPGHAYVERIRRASVAAVQAPEPVEPVAREEVLPSAALTAQQSRSAAVAHEHSVVRNRSEAVRTDEPKQVVITTDPAALVTSPHSRRLTPRAWPFAPGTRNDPKRVPNRTQLGLGVPLQMAPDGLPVPVAVPTKPVAAVKDDSANAAGAAFTPGFSTAFEEPTTRLMPRPPGDVPEARVTASSATASAGVAAMPISHVSARSAALPIAPIAPAAAAGEGLDESVPATSSSAASHDRSCSPSVPPSAASWSPTSTRPQRAALLRSIDAAKESSGRYSMRDAGVEYVERTRERDSRPDFAGPERTDLAGAAGEGAGTSRYSAPDDEDTAASRARRFTPKQRPAQRRGRSHDRPATRTKDDRVDLARTLPDIRSTTPGRHTPRGVSAQGRGGHDPSARQTGRLLLPSDTRRDSEPDHLADESAEFPANPDFVTTAPLAVPPTPRDFPSVVVEPSLRAESVTMTHAAKALPTPARVPSSQPVKGPAPAASSLPPMRVARKYEPLPNDAAAIEQLMREHAAARGVPVSRLNWNQQETLLIPREMLRAAPPKFFSDGRWRYLVAVSIAALLGVSIFLWTRRDALRALTTTMSAVRSDSVQGAGSSTLIATEPSGAELVQAGAVVGNTPVTVPRPSDGEVLYLVRMHGFESERVRVMPGSAQAIRVTLTPSAGAAAGNAGAP